MRQTSYSPVVLLALALVAITCMPAAAEDVSIITIECTGLNLTFLDGEIFDSGNKAGGTGTIGNATALGTINFQLDYVPVATLSSDVYADIFIQDVPGVAANSEEITGGGYVELLTSSDVLLGLSVDSMYFSYTDFGVPSMAFVSITGFAADSIVQNLPEGLVIDPATEITILLTGENLSGTSYEGGKLIGFQSMGRIEIEAAAIPEPSSLALLLSLAASALAVGVYSRRRS